MDRSIIDRLDKAIERSQCYLHDQGFFEVENY